MFSSECVAGMKVEDLMTPALLLDLDKLEANLDAMAEFVENSPVALRPHMKGHKNTQIAHMQLDRGAIGITCAKLGEAEVMIHSGIKDVLIANQVVDRNKINWLAGLARHANLMVAVDNLTNCRDLSLAAERYGVELGVLIEIDVGLERCGVKSPEEGVHLARKIHDLKNISFRGIMAYEGPFRGETRQVKERKVYASLARAIALKDMLAEDGFQVEIVSCGSTGTYDITGRYPGVTEIQAGTYPLMEGPYIQDGLPFQPALSVLSTVVSASEERVVLDAGLKAVTSDQGLPTLLDYPLPLEKINEEHSAFLVSGDGMENQTHGLKEDFHQGQEVQAGVPQALSPEDLRELRYLKVGDKISILPSHSCTTVNLYDQYYCVRGGLVEGIWQVHARGRVR